MASYRRTTAAALAVIGASVSLYPIFSGLAWFWAGCASVIVVALTGTLTRLRPLPVAVVLAGYVVALLLWLNFAFSNAKSLLHLLPTPASLAALFDIAGQGFTEAGKYAPPVPGLRGMLLLAAAGIGIVAVLTDVIAVHGGSAALAGLPLLLLVTEPFTLSVSPGFLGTTVSFCAGVCGYLTLLSSEGRDRIRAWEHPNPAARDEPDTRTLAAAGRRVGFASIALALCLPLFVPGLHVTRLFGGEPGIGGSGGGGGGARAVGATVGFPDPNTLVSKELNTTQAQDVLSYTTTDTNYPPYLQIYTEDQLTASGWQLSQSPDLVPVTPSLPQPPGLSASQVAGPTQTTSIGFASGVATDATGALPVPYPARTITASGNLKADKSTLMVFDKGVSFSSLNYKVTSLDELPTYSQLGAAPAPTAAVRDRDEQVPADYQSLKALALAKVRNAKTQMDEAYDLESWLSGGSFKYTLKAPAVLTAADLKKFLEVSKKGYCQQFAFAMAVLARLLGIPSRIAYGFTSGTEQITEIPQNPGNPQTSGIWLVTTHDAHAWPELYFQGYGWLRFEPTPGGTGGQGTASAPFYYSNKTNPNSPVTGTGQAAPVTGPTSAPNSGVNSHLLHPDQGGSGQLPASRSAAMSPWQILGLVLAGLIVIAAIAPWCARRLIRRRRWRHREGGTTRATRARGADRVRARDIAWAHAAWAELRDDLINHGAAALPSESPRAVAARAGTGLDLTEPARAALGRIALAEERARYAPAPADGTGLRTDSATVRRAIAAAVPRETRWRARLLPASVISPALSAIAAAADLYRGSRGSSPSRGRRFPWRPRS